MRLLCRRLIVDPAVDEQSWQLRTMVEPQEPGTVSPMRLRTIGHRIRLAFRVILLFVQLHRWLRQSETGRRIEQAALSSLKHLVIRLMDYLHERSTRRSGHVTHGTPTTAAAPTPPPAPMVTPKIPGEKASSQKTSSKKSAGGKASGSKKAPSDK